MAYTTINKPSDYFNTVLWTGNSGSQTITGVGFQPDFLWTKVRSDADQHQLRDAVRGINKVVRSSSNIAEYTVTSAGTFNSDGFTTTGTDGTEWNYSGSTYASWCWLANGSGSSNTDGTITSTVSANTTSGFSVVTYAGNSTAGATIGHGLGVAPEIVFYKTRTAAFDWLVYSKAFGATKELVLNSSAAGTTSSVFNNQDPTSTNLIVNTNSGNNSSSHTYVAYCFAPVKGFSKFGSYTGNGNADGTFVYTGFKPAFLIIKPSSAIENWQIFDNRRPGYNANDNIAANNSSTEDTASNKFVDLLSNGFKLRSATYSASSVSYIYMAFAEFPIVSSSGVPCTAR